MTTYDFYRTPETIALNNQLEIVNLKDYKFSTPKGICSMHGFAFYIKGKGFVKFKADDELPVPFSPIGGKKALQSIIDAGGFIEYDSLEFVNAI